MTGDTLVVPSQQLWLHKLKLILIQQIKHKLLMLGSKQWPLANSQLKQLIIAHKRTKQKNPAVFMAGLVSVGGNMKRRTYINDYPRRNFN
jgi:DNA-binding transcriptional regulator/RsmH inhibitor MraZ